MTTEQGFARYRLAPAREEVSSGARFALVSKAAALFAQIWIWAVPDKRVAKAVALSQLAGFAVCLVRLPVVFVVSGVALWAFAVGVVHAVMWG